MKWWIKRILSQLRTGWDSTRHSFSGTAWLSSWFLSWMFRGILVRSVLLSPQAKRTQLLPFLNIEWQHNLHIQTATKNTHLAFSYTALAGPSQALSGLFLPMLLSHSIASHIPPLIKLYLCQDFYWSASTFLGSCLIFQFGFKKLPLAPLAPN